MSPHGLVLLIAMAIGAAGKLILPEFAVRTALIAALAVPLGLALWLGETPSPLGLLLIAPLSLAGAAAGVAAGALLGRALGRFGRSD